MNYLPKHRDRGVLLRRLLLCFLVFCTSQLLGSGVQAAEFIPRPTAEEVRERLACLSGEVPLNYHKKVGSFIDYFTVRNREYIRIIQRLAPTYFPIFEYYLDKYDLPQELKYLAIVESGLRPGAISRVGAVGLWQFMPSTGRMYGLYQNAYKDDRRDPHKATEAACRYLRDLHRMFGDWELALAAFNSGPGNVRKAIRRSGKRKFWKLYRYLPRETRAYVPQFVAITYAMNYAPHHNLYPNRHEYMPEYTTIQVSGPLDFGRFSNALQVCSDELVTLNPQYLWRIIPDSMNTHSLRIPIAAQAQYLAQADSIHTLASLGVLDDWVRIQKRQQMGTYGRTRIRYRVRRGDVLGKIARRYGVSVSQIRKWNRLSGSLIRVGQRLTLWIRTSAPAASTSLAQKKTTQQSTQKVTQKSTQKSTQKATQKSTQKSTHRELIHIVRYGNTLGGIARRYKVSVHRLRKWNGLRSDLIRVGQRLVIHVPVVDENTKHYVVRSGDTLWNISMRFSQVSIQDLKRLNRLRSNRIYPGQRLILWQ